MKTSMRGAWLAGMALMALSGTVVAEDWWVVYAGSDPYTLELLLVDKDSLAAVAGPGRAQRSQMVALLDGLHVATVQQYRCATRQTKIESANAFSNDGAPSAMKMQFPDGWTALPNDVHEAAFSFVCAPQDREKNGMRPVQKGLDRASVVEHLERVKAQAAVAYLKGKQEQAEKAKVDYVMDELDVLLNNKPAAPASAESSR